MLEPIKSMTTSPMATGLTGTGLLGFIDPTALLQAPGIIIAATTAVAQVIQLFRSFKKAKQAAAERKAEAQKK